MISNLLWNLEISVFLWLHGRALGNEKGHRNCHWLRWVNVLEVLMILVTLPNDLVDSRRWLRRGGSWLRLNERICAHEGVESRRCPERSVVIVRLCAPLLAWRLVRLRLSILARRLGRPAHGTVRRWLGCSGQVMMRVMVHVVMTHIIRMVVRCIRDVRGGLRMEVVLDQLAEAYRGLFSRGARPR